MKMTVRLMVCVFALVLAEPNNPTQIEKYHDTIKTYHLDVPGKDPITIIENRDDATKWKDISVNPKQDEAEIKNLMTHIVHDLDGSQPRCYGPSCQNGFDDDGVRESNEGIEDFEDYMLAAEKLKDYSDYSKDRLQAITALAAKLKKEKLKYHMQNMQNAQNSQDDVDDNDGNGKVHTTWNRLKVKQHKNPYDDKEGWVTLEPVAWSSSKISKWKPNVKKQKPNHWNEDDDRFPDDDDDDRYSSSHGSGNHFDYPQKKPSLTRPAYINNKLHLPSDDESELPSRPTWASSLSSSSSPSWTSQSSSSTWTKPQKVHHNHPLAWAPDESRRPHKPNCDSDDNKYSSDDAVYYGMSDSVVTDPRPPNFPQEYEALHQASMTKRPLKRPTQVVYAGSEYESDRGSSRPYGDSSRPSYGDSSRPQYHDSLRPQYDDSPRPTYSDSSRPQYSDNSRPPFGDGQWVLLSTTKGYRHKKRQRSLNPVADDRADVSTMTSHQAVALTVLPVDNTHTNMTTSHGGMLEVEKSFQTVEESKRDMDKKNDLETSASQIRPTKNRVIRRKIVSNVSPDSSTLLAAVGAGMVPATMAMVVPMMLGRRRRRRDVKVTPVLYLDNMFRYR